MIPFNRYVHYIWVGPNAIPDNFLLNFNCTKEINSNYEFILWQDDDIIKNDSEYAILYQNSNLFHKLQIARYTILDKFGGIYSDFDIKWKKSFDEIYQLFDTADMIFPKRNSLHFYNRGLKTDLIDDFTIFTKSNLTKQFLIYCKNRTEKRDYETEPFSVYALTEWLLTQTNIKFLSHLQIDNNENCYLGIHDNKKTWRKDN